jgi:GMP synthase (glutamine-hydrolysing)
VVSTQPVLVVEHQTSCPPGWVGEWLEDAGCLLDVRRPHLGQELPDHLGAHSALVVLGGSMDAALDDRYPWMARVMALVREAAGAGVPTLGICLGHQLAAVALGGEVARNGRGQQIGVLEVGWTAEAEGDPLVGGLTGPVRAVQWNNDVVTRLPEGAHVLARTPEGEVQAVRFSRTVWGVQWHPEAGAEIVTAWAENDRDAVRERGLDVDGYVDAVRAAHDELRRSWRPLAEALAALARDEGSAW